MAFCFGIRLARSIVARAITDRQPASQPASQPTQITNTSDKSGNQSLGTRDSCQTNYHSSHLDHLNLDFTRNT